MSGAVATVPARTSSVAPMEVALVDRTEANMTGLKRYSSTLVRQLQEQGVRARLVAPRSPVPAPVAARAKRLGWDATAFFDTYPLRGSFGDAELVHLANETMATLLALGTPAKPSVVTVHAFFTYLLRNAPELSTHNHRFDRWFDGLAVRGLRRATAIIAVSHYVKEALIKDLGIPSQRIHVVHEAVDHRQFRPMTVPDRFRRAHRLPEGPPYLLYVGSEQPRKNLPTLLRAFARVRERVPEAILLKVGQPEVARERERATALIEVLGLSDAVRFFDHAGEELPFFYNLADVFVFPSRYEGFGFPPLEAMACGTPVVSANVTSLPEVTGDAAVLVSPMDEAALADAVTGLLCSASLRHEYRERGLANVRRFSWARTARETVAVYRAVAGAEPIRWRPVSSASGRGRGR